MNRTNKTESLIRPAFCAVLLLTFLLTLNGCVGVVGPGYDGPGYDYGPDFWIFGGYGHGHWDRDAGRRGFESRGGISHGGFHGRR